MNTRRQELEYKSQENTRREASGIQVTGCQLQVIQMQGSN